MAMRSGLIFRSAYDNTSLPIAVHGRWLSKLMLEFWLTERERAVGKIKTLTIAVLFNISFWIVILYWNLVFSFFKAYFGKHYGYCLDIWMLNQLWIDVYTFGTGTMEMLSFSDVEIMTAPARFTKGIALDTWLAGLIPSDLRKFSLNGNLKMYLLLRAVNQRPCVVWNILYWWNILTSGLFCIIANQVDLKWKKVKILGKCLRLERMVIFRLFFFYLFVSFSLDHNMLIMTKLCTGNFLIIIWPSVLVEAYLCKEFILKSLFFSYTYSVITACLYFECVACVASGILLLLVYDMTVKSRLLHVITCLVWNLKDLF